MFKHFFDFLFPKTCFGCGSWGEYLCSDCLNLIRANEKMFCPECGQPAILGQTHPSCRRPYGLAGLTAVFAYRGIIRRLISALKYRFVTDLTETILELFLSFSGENKAFVKFVRRKNVYLTPVPLYWQRENWRGFNQAELLGEKISRSLNIDYIPKLLVRTKNTPPQITLKKAQRLENVQGVFKFNKDLINCFNYKTANVIIFDDVWTTGATIKEAAQVLKRKGVKNVWALVLAC